jgi:hypothetical protein
MHPQRTMKLKANSGKYAALAGALPRTRANPAIRNVDISKTPTGQYSGIQSVRVARKRVNTNKSESDASVVVRRIP